MYVLGTSGESKLVDFGQLVVRGRFTATAVLASVDASVGNADTFRDIIVRAHAAGFDVDFDAGARPGEEGAEGGEKRDPEVEAEAAEFDDFIVTLFSAGRLPSQLLAETTRFIAEAGANIVTINRLSDDGDEYMCVELGVSVPRDGSVESLRSSLFSLGRATAGSDVALQPARLTRMAKRIVVFDLSWTLVRCDAVDVLLEASGLEMKERGEFQEGRVSGTEWLRARVKRLGGERADTVNAAAVGMLRYTDGAKKLCKGLRRLGCRLAVVSSGSRMIAERAKEDLGLDYAYGNNFEVDADGCFTGIVSEPVIDAERKADLVQMLAMQEGVDAEQVVAVGDGPVSSKMLTAAGMSVAFDQPNSVEDLMTGRISSKSLASVFYLLGVTGRDFRELLETG